MARYLFTALLFFAVVSTSAAGTRDDSLIVPGSRLGPIALGMTLPEIEETLGAPVESHADQRFYVWHPRTPSGPLVVIFNADGKVVQVKTYWDVYYTTVGMKLHTGMIESDVRALLGRPRRTISFSHYRVLYYPGIDFTVDTRNINIVTGIGVIPRGGVSAQAAR